MSIPMNSYCVDCLLKKHVHNARQLGDSETAYAFAKAVMELFLTAAPEESSAIIGARINKLYTKFYGLPLDRFKEEKEQSNRFVMARLDAIRERLKSAADPVLTGLQYAIMGNYIDFSALGKNVSFEALDEMLQAPEKFSFDLAVYESLCQDLQNAKTLLYLTDNAGELGFDWLLAEVLQCRYPQLQITFCVRGMPAHNDATREDYEFMGIPFPVMDNGSDIGGTDLASVSPETIHALENTDVIIAKGMGNTETLYGCGYNVYYALLMKCKRLQQVFGAPFMSATLARERSAQVTSPIVS